jgi:hypothetical protein
MMVMQLSEQGELTRQSIVQLIENREEYLAGNAPRGGYRPTDRRIRGALEAMLSRSASDQSVVFRLVGLDDNGWQTWIELQQWLAYALRGNGGFDALEAACEDLGLDPYAGER